MRAVYIPLHFNTLSPTRRTPVLLRLEAFLLYASSTVDSRIVFSRVLF